MLTRRTRERPLPATGAEGPPTGRLPGAVVIGSILALLLPGTLAGLEVESPVGQEPPDSTTPVQEADVQRWVEHQGMRVDESGRAVRVTATLQAGAFMASTPPDHQYHALVNRNGGAADKALFVTDASDRAIAEELRRLGARDGGGVPLAAWNLRWVPLVPQPDSRVSGSVVGVHVDWEGAPRTYDLAELLDDREGRGVEIRFGGNEEHDEHWHSGCIVCLYSCPGGVLSNASYSIRDHQRGATSFEPGDLLPPDGTEVTITFVLGPDST